MIFAYSNVSFTNSVLCGIALCTAIAAAILAWHWGWKAWPWVLLSTPTLPLIRRGVDLPAISIECPLATRF
jgi:hypothetical protein